MFKAVNIGTTDRILRIVIGVALLATAYVHLIDIWQWVVAIIGIVLILTALVRFCPLYRIIGTSTARD